MIAETVATTLGGGLLGASVKIVVGIFSAWLRNKKEDRDERLALADKQIALKKLGPDPNSKYVSHTRRVLAWGVCFTFCAVVLLWATFPSTHIAVPGGATSWSIDFFFFDFSKQADMVQYRSTGSIVWSMLPFLSMILATYFTPNIAEK